VRQDALLLIAGILLVSILILLTINAALRI
jgi:hypothetical protein